MSEQKLDDSVVEQLLRFGWTQRQVVAWYRLEKLIEVSQSAISHAIKSGRIKVDTDYNTGGVPWQPLKPEHRSRHAARMLRTQARLDRGMPVGRTLALQVTTWREGLVVEDAVIHYDCDTEEGFRRVPRRRGVDLWWFRDPAVDDDGLPVRSGGRGTTTRP